MRKRTRNRNKFENSQAKNLKMNKETYRLRRIVMSFIYEAKEVVKLPRIDVRITEDTNLYAGLAKLNGNILWINHTMLSYNQNYIRALVYHEIIHACFGVRHIKGCILMDAVGFNIHSAPSKDVCDKLMKKYSTHNLERCMC